MNKRQEFGYILRYYLPVKPYFDEIYTEKRFEQLIEFCKRASIRAVMFFVALNPDFYYMPDAPEYALQWREQMLPYIERLRKEGISYQLNFQNLIGSTVGATDFTKQYDWEYLVDHKGRTSLGCACPIGPKFRENAAKRLQIWAETKPDVIWIDDDLRMHNHGTGQVAVLEGEPSYEDYYCYCDSHISLFNERFNTHYTRETLISEILQSGKSSKIRNLYLDFLNDTIKETATWVQEIVHKVSPNTHIAQMTSVPDVHAAEGRVWKDFLPALAGKHTPITRPHFGPYMEAAPRDFIQSYRMLAQMMTQIAETYKGQIKYSPEIENTRFTIWAKSAAATSFQLALAAFMGCKDITLSLYDLEGGAIDDEPLYGKVLVREKDFLNKCSNISFEKYPFIGVKIPTSSTSGKRYALHEGDDYAQLGGRRRYIENYLLTMGIPCYFISDVINENGVFALDEFTANYLTDEEILSILSKSVLLDAGAAEILLEKGFGAYIGIKSMQRQTSIVNAEILHTITRDDGTYIRLPLRTPSNCWCALDLHKNVEVLSSFLTPDGKKSPAMTLFTNELGGQIAIYPASGEWGDGFYNHLRVQFFKDLFAKLDPKLPQVDGHGAMLTVVKQGEGNEKYYFVANLAADKVDELVINGKKRRESLRLYQAVVYKQKEGKIYKLGKTKL